MGLPDAMDVHRRMRRVAREFEPERLLLGETYVLELEKLMQYLVPDGLQLCMNLVFLHTPFVAEELAGTVARTEELFPEDGAPVWHGSSHDDSRFASRWCWGDEDAIRCALIGLLSLRGSCVLYQGDEIGMETVPVPRERRRDVAGRDPCRTPMVWRDDEGAGFTEPGVEPWLPIGDRSRNVEAQRGERNSILNLTHDLIQLRKHRLILSGAYEPLEAPEGVWAFRREGGALVALNLGDEDATLEDVYGAILIASDRARDEELVDSVLELGPLEAAIVATAEPG
jgi:alpha-glucosidase